MALTFDPVKGAANIVKHGVSLAAAAEMEIVLRLASDRAGEVRVQAFGFISDKPYCLVYTVRDGDVWAISLRRATLREIGRHAS